MQRVLTQIEERTLADEELSNQLLRFLCNSVAEEDESRELVLPHFSFIWKAVETPTLRLSALSAALNLCQGYEPAQEAVIKQNILPCLEELWPKYDRNMTQVVLRLINIIFPKVKEAETLPPTSLICRLIMATASAPGVGYDQDDFVTCMDALLPILRDCDVQEEIGKSNSKNIIFDLLENTVIRLNSVTTVPKLDEDSDENPHVQASEDEEDDSVEEIVSFATELVAINADIALHWSLDLSTHTLIDEDVQDLIQILKDEFHQDWIKDKRLFRSRAAALMLGNVVQSENIAEVLGKQDGLVGAAVKIIAGGGIDLEVRYGAAGMLRNLAVEKGNKEKFRECGIFDGVRSLLTNTNVELVLAGLKLLRSLLHNSITNCTTFLSSSESENKQILPSLVAVLDTPADPKHQTEAARVVVAIFRTMALQSEEEPSITAQLNILSSHSISSILKLTTNPDPRLKSEAYMTLALLSRSPSGAKSVYSALKTHSEFLGMFKEALERKDDEKGSMAGKDRENVLAMSGFLLRFVEDMDGREREGLKRLFERGRTLPIR